MQTFFSEKFTLDVVAQTIDAAQQANEVFFPMSRAQWTFNANGTVDAQGQWTKIGTTVAVASEWTATAGNPTPEAGVSNTDPLANGVAGTIKYVTENP